jgi:hypothetical protein
MQLNRESLLGKSLAKQEVKLDAGNVWVRELKASEVGEYIKRHKGSTDELDQMAWLVIRGTCDEAGQPVFTQADAEAVKGMSLKTLKAIAEGVAKVSGLSGEDDPKKTEAD